MAARSTWKGYLKISLVNIPVRVFPATDSASTISFNQLHGECQTRIKQKRWCYTCDREVDRSEIVKGYEFDKGRYVVLEDEDIAKVRPESSRIINLVKFADDQEIDPIYLEKSYYLAPDGAVASEAFAVMREAMHGKAGVGKLAIGGREHLVAVRPRGRGLVMHTLKRAAEVRSMDAIDELDALPDRVNPDEIKLAQQVMGNFESELDLSEYTDEYQAELRKMIDAKVAGEEFVAPPEEAPEKVVNLMDALRKSLDQVSAEKKKTAKADLPKRASSRKRKRAAG
jgi:DNA end-binding protein Ku